MSVNLKNYINGELTDLINLNINHKNNNYIDIYNPAKNIIHAKIPNSNKSDLNAAIESAKRAQYGWQQTSTQDRSNWLRKLAEAIKKHSNKLALAECRDTGKPLNLAKTVDIPRASYNFEFFADLITCYSNKSYSNNNSINYSNRHPLGIIACISPWNLPLYLLTWKIAPALVTGNCVITKPSEVTPYTASLLAEICTEINFPAGVLSILHGYGNQIGELIVNHPDISAISFTGGTQTGKIIAEQAGRNLKKVSLELGGKNPAVVFSDCSLDKTVDTITKSAFTNQGQVCLCNSRVYIEDKIYDKFKQKLIAKTNKIITGDPEDLNTEFGVITSKAQYDKILNYINDAIEQNGVLLTNNNYKNNLYNYIPPTILENLDINSDINQEEVFGPVITLNKFNQEHEAIELANNTKYGLAACVFSNDITKANRVANQINSGIVWINNWMQRDLRTPFGGMKQSGIGREGGFNSFNFFTEEQNIYFDLCF